MREKLFSISIRDCDVQDMTAGGPGGQHQNRSHTAIRVLHRPSGAIGVSREFKSQLQNKRAAFRRMGESQAFLVWARIRAAQLAGEKSVDQRVDEDLAPVNVQTEIKDTAGRWVVVDPSVLQ